MAQYKDGNAKIATGAPTVVILDTGITTDNIQAGDLFRFQADDPNWYQVSGIVSAQSFSLSAPYTGGKAFDTFFDYVVTRDFTPNLGIPELSPGDVDIRDVYTFSMRLLDALIGPIGGGGPTPAFPSGTRMLFDQDTPPTGWTKETDVNDKVVMITSGGRADGGSWFIPIAVHRHEVPVSIFRASIPGVLSPGRPPFGAGSTQIWCADLDEGGQNLHVASLSGPPVQPSSDGTWRPLFRSMIIGCKD